MKEWSTACPDWEQRIVARQSLVPMPPLFPEEAAAALAVFKELIIRDAPGSPKIGDACRPWILSFAEAVFGSYDHETGRRLIQEYLLLVSKKNTKSTVAAAIMMTALIRNWRLSAEYLILAPTIEIANNSFYPARDMVKADPELEALFHVQEHTRTITHRGTRATLKVVAADNNTVSGKKATGILVDELWLFGKRPGAENMLLEATGGLASRPEGFVIYLTTQSDEPPAGVMDQKLKYARGVRDGRIADKHFLPILYEFPEAMLKAKAHRLPQNFYVTNPNLGLTVDEHFLQSRYDKAIEGGEGSIQGFLAKHLNVEIGLALRSDRWAGADVFLKAAVPSLTLDEIIRSSDVLVAGGDGGGLDDLLALAILGRLKSDPKQWRLWCHAWAHPTVYERRKSIVTELERFQKDGHLTRVENMGDDIAQLVAILQKVDASKKLVQVGLDAMGVGSIVDALDEAGINGDRVVAVSQGWQLTNAIRTAERKLADGTLTHCGQPLLAWAVGNARVEPRGNAVIITKQVSGATKIDPLMASFNTVALMSRNPEPPKQKLKASQIFGGTA
ncbi:terminase [Pseudoroseomonas deserti]|uniref:Terminase n=1 Tax=Teichococcus deserti TaxID=1817963 RepID=A0A1V2H229_9PROT|nr:terminase TerL endonuclease subunit [Pseudoroseomonas deserti]ONG53457.1 terminase [Pseudoroseomonas deserti]